MGWWNIDPANDSGQPFHLPDGEVQNPNMNPKARTGYYNGDGPADLIGDALKKTIECYEMSFGRPPTWLELKSAVNFSLNIYRPGQEYHMTHLLPDVKDKQ